MRKVTGLVEVPYDRYPDGRPKTFEAWQLACGHAVRVHVNTARQPRPAFTSLPMPHERTCPQCPEED